MRSRARVIFTIRTGESKKPKPVAIPLPLTQHHTIPRYSFLCFLIRLLCTVSVRRVLPFAPRKLERLPFVRSGCAVLALVRLCLFHAIQARFHGLKPRQNSCQSGGCFRKFATSPRIRLQSLRQPLNPAHAVTDSALIFAIFWAWLVHIALSGIRTPPQSLNRALSFHANPVLSAQYLTRLCYPQGFGEVKPPAYIALPIMTPSTRPVAQ
jgi:hypothetical protein